MEGAMNKVQYGVKSNGRNINPRKTVFVIFTRRYNTWKINERILDGIKLKLSLIVTLNQKLQCISNIKKSVKRGYIQFVAA